MGQEIEMANKYSIKDKDSGKKILYAVEETGCCARQLKQCMGDCAPWNVKILYVEDDAKENAFTMDRPFTCTFLCCNRPTVTINDESGETIGTVSDPCNCFGMDLAAKDPDGNTLFSANGGCCQLGVCCPLPCGPCSKVEYQLKDSSGNDIGLLTKKVPGICKWFFAADVNNYIVDFEDSEVWTGKNKALMVGLALFMDFRYFSDNPNDDDKDPVAGGPAADILGAIS